MGVHHEQRGSTISMYFSQTYAEPSPLARAMLNPYYVPGAVIDHANIMLQRAELQSLRSSHSTLPKIIPLAYLRNSLIACLLIPNLIKPFMAQNS